MNGKRLWSTEQAQKLQLLSGPKLEEAMAGELTKLSETRWRYAIGRRLYFIKQLKTPNEDLQQLGVFVVDGGRGDIQRVNAEAVELVAFGLSQIPQTAPKGDPALW